MLKIRAKRRPLRGMRQLLFRVGLFAAIGGGAIYIAGVQVYAAMTTNPTIEQHIYVKTDGSAPFDASTWDGVNNSASQGQDANADNGVVRVHDTITYSIEASINEASADNVTATVQLSGGQKCVKVPSQCRANGVSPQSSLSSDGKTLVCNVGNQQQGSKLAIYADALVNSAANGDNVSASLTTDSDQTSPLPVVSTEDVLVTANFSIDIENLSPQNGNGAVSYSYGVDNPSGNPGIVVDNLLTVRLPRGSELPAGNSQTVTFTMLQYGPGVTQNWRLYTWGTEFCKANSNVIGSISCSQSGPGQPVSVTVSGLDYSRATNPASQLYSFVLRTWFPPRDSNAGQLIGGSTTGTGATPWTATAPTDLNDVVAFRVLTQLLAVGTAPQTVSYSIRPTDNRGGDVYCNNFSSRVPEISLEVRSNTVCARVAGGSWPIPVPMKNTTSWLLSLC